MLQAFVWFQIVYAKRLRREDAGFIRRITSESTRSQLDIGYQDRARCIRFLSDLGTGCGDTARQLQGAGSFPTRSHPTGRVSVQRARVHRPQPRGWPHQVFLLAFAALFRRCDRIGIASALSSACWPRRLHADQLTVEICSAIMKLSVYFRAVLISVKLWVRVVFLILGIFRSIWGAFSRNNSDVYIVKSSTRALRNPRARS
jgi:hypothetical protein